MEQVLLLIYYIVSRVLQACLSLELEQVLSSKTYTQYYHCSHQPLRHNWGTHSCFSCLCLCQLFNLQGKFSIGISNFSLVSPITTSYCQSPFPHSLFYILFSSLQSPLPFAFAEYNVLKVGLNGCHVYGAMIRFRQSENGEKSLILRSLS